MTIGRSAMPLVSIGAVALDTETTGLDGRKAQIVEIGALRIVQGEIVLDQPFRSLVLLGVHGDIEFAETLWRHAFDIAGNNPSFAKRLVENVGSLEPGRTWLSGLRTVGGRIDLKKTGLFGLVRVARALAICHHVTERSTPTRLNGLRASRVELEKRS